MQEKYEVFFLFQKQGSYDKSEVLPSWQKLIGERALVLDDPATVCDTIAGIVGVLEQKVSIEELEEDLGELGTSSSHVKSTSKAVALATSGGITRSKDSGKGTNLATTSGVLPDIGVDLGATSRI